VTAMVVSAFSVDELRALSRLTGMPLAPMLQAEPAEQPDAPLCDVVAVRSLVARGLVWLAAGHDGVPRPVLAPGCRRALAPLAAAEEIVEVELEVGGELLRHVLASGGGGLLHLAERDPDVWALRDDDRGLGERLATMVERHADGATPPRGVRLELPTATHLVVDALLLEGFDDQVEPELGRAGVPGPAARAWAAALTGRRGAGAVRAARRGGGDVFAGGEVRWVAAGPHGLWLVSEGDQGEGTTVVRDVAADELLAAVATLLAADHPDRSVG
jgi:hypothetical protein